MGATFILNIPWFHVRHILWTALVALILFFPSPSTQFTHRLHLKRLSNNTDPISACTGPRLQNATLADLEHAQALVKDALQQVAAMNKARLDNPKRNNWQLKPGTKLNRRNDQEIPAPPLFQVTFELAEAAALVAEAEAASKLNGNATIGTLSYHNNTSSEVKCQPSVESAQGGSFWMENIARKGSWPFNPDSSFQVFRNVKDFGAKGDGLQDDTVAINRAINSTRRCGAGCNGSSTTNAIVYFPAGTYLVSGTVNVLFGTQMIGDATNWPTIKAAPSFLGLGVFSTDTYTGGGKGPDGQDQEWYINTASFYRQIRNFKFDITQTPENNAVAAIHYQVAQATSLQNIQFTCSTNDGTTQQAIFAENGSGGVMSDLTFIGGKFGIYGGNQQFTAQRLKFSNIKTAVQLIWDWGWTWKSIEIDNCGTGFSLLSEDGTHHTGSILVLDSVFSNTQTAILTFPAATTPGTGTSGITLDNVAFNGVNNAVADNQGKVYLAGSVGSVDTWALGPIYSDSASRGVSLGMAFKTPREPSLLGSAKSGLPKAPFFERSKPQYETLNAGSFVHMKDHAKGDGVTDDTVAFQNVLNQYAGSSIIFIDAGSYVLTDTITIPAGARIVGEAWSQLMASGTKFSNQKKPQPLIRVGQDGQTGSVEMQDLIFTTIGPTAGVILVEWNLLADAAGSAGMWDCHVRIGGALGTKLTSHECPPATSGTDPNCSAASLLVHISPDASAYIENFWAWVADHDIDDPDWNDPNNNMIQTSVYVARGMLIESKAATWLYGTASEHSVMYQYNFWKAENVFAGMIQTESPYYQPTPQPPAPFGTTVGTFPGDPTYKCAANPLLDGCDEAWAVLIRNSTNISISGAGLYSWFTTYTQTCVDSMNCQKILVLLEDNFENIHIHNLITIGATNMLVADGQYIKAKDNLAVSYHPYWSQITVFDPIQNAANPEPGNSCGATKSRPRPTPTIQEIPPIDTGAPIPIYTPHHEITLVNASPYDWVVTGEHTYQMTAWNWSDVPAGSSVKNIVWYDSQHNVVDDKGEVHYSIRDTDQTFSILGRTQVNQDSNHPFLFKVSYDNLSTKDAAKNTVFDVPFFHRTNSGQYWTLMGSKDYGYWSSYSPPVAWMSSTMDIIGERKLRHVCMPGSHDAGMSIITDSSFADAGNCKTQGINIHDQMVRGSRWFDIRPVINNSNQYLLGHWNTDGFAAGCNGEYVTDVIDGANKFTTGNPELIIFYISHDFSAQSAGNNSFKSFTTEQWNRFLDLFDKLDNRCLGFQNDLTDYKIKDFIGNGKPCVLVVAETSDAHPARPDKGIYDASMLPHFDSYSDTKDLQQMMDDQIAKLHRNRNLVPGNGLAEQFHLLSWTLTQDTSLAIGQGESIQDLAALAEQPLADVAWPAFSPQSYPNVLYMDFIGTTDPDIANDNILSIAMAVNLYLASQNCYVGGGHI